MPNKTNDCQEYKACKYLNLVAKCSAGWVLGTALDFYGALRSRTYDAHILEVLMRVPQSKHSPYIANYNKDVAGF